MHLGRYGFQCRESPRLLLLLNCIRGDARVVEASRLQICYPLRNAWVRIPLTPLEFEMKIRLTYTSDGELPREQERFARSFLYTAASSNGKTADFQSVNRGSIPRVATMV